jgi:hypothetical protein
MASKYDPYWQTQLDTIDKLIDQAAEEGQSERQDMSEITSLGDRESWAGNVRILNGQVARAKNAHMVALGRLLTNRLPEGLDASISMSPAASLVVRGGYNA